MTLMMQDKRVLVTGAGRGLGATIAQGFAREGASVIVADLDPALARASAQANSAAGGRANDAALDVTQAQAVRPYSPESQAPHRAIDALVNNNPINV
ncbi:SDR family NAD(P)-dependent oxidoreductase, partial [Achromobacter xylosoxidans]|uniref:SDR family NAD(P)-dependent oxidoreductase n=1 Tax=Alcaligenes xylosoxydans xylosoxydans TaxID=85698 RepID=UPI0037611AC5